jgi:predicted alpha/beta superfamily hydrolase
LFFLDSNQVVPYLSEVLNLKVSSIEVCLRINSQNKVKVIFDSDNHSSFIL